MNLIETIKPFLERICKIIKIIFADYYNNVRILTKYIKNVMILFLIYSMHMPKIKIQGEMNSNS